MVSTDEAENGGIGALGGRTASALSKRAEQLKRWEESETNRETHEFKPDSKRKVAFPEGCVFLAACASGDIDDVKKLLDKGADINTANVDGLTSLHQAVIDENPDMVKFLVDHRANIDAQDNEGWTSLHAAVSCGFHDIVRFLIDAGADIGIPNSDGELAVDLAETPDMVELIGEEVAKRGIDLEVARHREENAMLSDALEMLHNDDPSKLWPTHPANGATPLHVASAKGYIKVMNILLQAGHPVDSQDLDGWTPLHAAAHWGEKQACETLVEHMARMDVRNKDGHTCFDLADEKVLPVLKELEAKQAERKKENVPIIHEDVAVGGDRKRSSGSSSSVKGHVKGATITKADMLKEAKVRTSASESDSDMDVPPTDEDNNEVFARPSAPVPLKEIPQISLPPTTELSSSVEAKETPMEVTKLPEIGRISPPPQEKSDVNSAVPPPLPVSPVPEDLASIKPEKRPSAESEDKPRKRPDLLVTSASSIASAKTAVTTPLSPTATTASVAQPAPAVKTAVAAPIRPSPHAPPRIAVCISNPIVLGKPSESRPLYHQAKITVSPRTDLPKAPTYVPKPPFSPPTSPPPRSMAPPSFVNDPPARQSPIPSWRLGRLPPLTSPPSSPSVVSTAQLPTVTATVVTTSSASTPLAATEPTPTAKLRTKFFGAPSSADSASPASVPRRPSFVPPKRDEETEMERKSRARFERLNRRSTQGITKDSLEALHGSHDSETDKKSEAQADAKVNEQLEAEKRVASTVEPTTTTATTTTYSWRNKYPVDRPTVSSTAQTPRVTSAVGASGTPVTPSTTPEPHNEASSGDLSMMARRRSRANRRPTGPVMPGDIQEMGDPHEDQENTKDVGTPYSGDDLQTKPEKIQSHSSIVTTVMTSTKPTLAPTSSSAPAFVPTTGHLSSTAASSNSLSTTLAGYKLPYHSTRLSSQPSSRTSSLNSVNSVNTGSASGAENDPVDYKKLYEEERRENEKLRQRLKESEDRLEGLKPSPVVHKPQMNGSIASLAAPSTDKERRALERKLAELEEEVQQVDSLRAANKKLKEENQALVRVISKLSK